MSPRTLIVLLTRNPGTFAPAWIKAQQSQVQPHDVLVIDSSSTDGSQELFRAAGYQVVVIPPERFNHGGTRQLGVELAEGYDFLVYMTQDALLKGKGAVERLLMPLKDEKVAAVCGRQIPHLDANPLAVHARSFNYPPVSHVYSKDDIPKVGIKAAFLSDSFAAYRRSALVNAGGFPERVIFGEDFQVACMFLKAGLKVAYAADAEVFHSHNYSPWVEFRRYFDAGVSHRLDYWMIDLLGSAGGAGIRFWKSETQFLLRNYPSWLPRSILHNLLKYGGYKMGLHFKLLSNSMRKRFSYDQGFWERTQLPAV